MVVSVEGRDARNVRSRQKLSRLQVPSNRGKQRREGAKVKQRVLATLGQLDALSATGKIDDLTLALSKSASHLKIIDAHRQGTIQAHCTVAIGPALVFERLWHELHIDEAIK